MSGNISWAEGSFPYVVGVTSEHNTANTANSYSLQLNSNFFGSTACNGHTGCQAWEQFVYEGTGGGFIQYWLINYGATCPTTGGWNSTPLAPGDCYRNADHGVPAPAEPVTALADIALMGLAGSSDTITISIKDVLYMTSQSSIVGLNSGWTTAEFNVFGDQSGDEAIFNTPATISVQTLTDSVSGTTSAPTCSAASFTGETNNLSLVTTACCPIGGTLPGIQFEESNSSPLPPNQACPLVDVNSQLTWYNSTSGDEQAWDIQDITRTSYADFPPILQLPASSGWAFVGSADFNGDGEADILAHNGASGAFQVWYMNGVNRASAANFDSGLNLPNSSGWSLVAIADFNNDDHPDLLFNNSATGASQAWFMNGIVRTSFFNLDSSLNFPSGSLFVDAADFNGDGNPDLLFYNTTTGGLRVWYMNGVTRTSVADLSSGLDVLPSSGWAIVDDIVDYNGDGKPDLLWYMASTGALQAWYMDGITRINPATFPSSLDVPASTGWSIIPHSQFVRVPVL